MCDPPLVFAILETLTLLRRACENEFLDEVSSEHVRITRSLTRVAQDNPSYEFTSDRVDLTLHLTDDYHARNQMLALLQLEAHNWFELALGRAPWELHATLQVSCTFL